MKPTTKLLAIYLFCHLMIIPAVMIGTWQDWALSFAIFMVTVSTVMSAGYHRYLSHNAFVAGKWYSYYVQIFAVFMNLGPALPWIGVHRMHHAYSDTEKDPHSPLIKGFWNVYSHQWGYTTSIEPKFIRRLLTDKTLVWFNSHYYKMSIGIALLFLAISPTLFLFGYCMPIAIAFHSIGIFQTYTHYGPDGVQNSNFVNITGGFSGEGMHKNHHERPADYYFSTKWYHIDLAAVWIKLIKK